MLHGMKETRTKTTGFAIENQAQGSSHSTERCGRHQNLI